MLNWLKKRLKIIRLYHKYYRISGLYKFLFKNISRVALIIFVILIIFLLVERYIIDFDVLFNELIGKLKWYYVLVIFFLSETFFGLIPPDLFIIWSKHFPDSYLVLTFLALLSFLGGIISYKIGKIVRSIPRINKNINHRFTGHFVIIKKWGGIVIIFAALFPLPYATISMVAGVMHYPFNHFFLFGLSRIARFYIYAFFLFNFI